MGRVERLALYVALTALTAFAIDGVLPVMPIIEARFAPEAPLSGSQIITAFVLGMAIGELMIGPLSDAKGRRPAVVFGLAVFVFGTVFAATADTFGAVVFGRFLQGIGVAGPKIGTRAMIRDRYAGSDMARVMSIIFTLLILVPMIAPAIGALISAVIGWRGLFWAYLTLAVVLGSWLWVRHPESLPLERRLPLQPRRLARDVATVMRCREVMSVVVATGFVFGAQLTYFSLAAEIFGQQYGRSSMMPAIFAVLATGTGVALILNIRLVGRTGMEIPILAGLVLLATSGTGLVGAAMLTEGHPPLTVLIFLAWFGFFALGLLFGNLNAFAMRPLGDLAGLGSSIVASVSSLVAFVFASVIEILIAEPVWAFSWAFIIAALLSAAVLQTAFTGETRTWIIRLFDGHK